MSQHYFPYHSVFLDFCHKMEYKVATSEEGESQIRASKTAPANENALQCKRCFSVLKSTLNMTYLEAAFVAQKAFSGDSYVKDFSLSENPHQQ